MSQLVLVNGGFKRNFVSKIVMKFSLGPYFLISSMVGMVVLITVITLMFSTSQITKGYVLNSLDENNQGLTKELEENDMLISQARSLNHIQETEKVKSMIRANSVVFVSGDTAIASNR